MAENPRQQWNPQRVGLLLTGLVCVVPFLQPRHFPPIRTFYDEWLAVALGIASAAVLMIPKGRPVPRFPATALWLVAFALFLVVRVLAVHSAYPEISLTWALYVLFGALMAVVGRELAVGLQQSNACEFVAALLLGGSLANSIAAILQVTGIPGPLDSFVSHLHGTRAMGNVGQSNLFTNYLALGVASLAYLYTRDRVRLPAALAAGSLLLVAIALGASRATFLYFSFFVLVSGFAFARFRNPSTAKSLRAAIAIAAAGLLLLWVVPLAVNGWGVQIEGGFQRNAPPGWTGASDASASLRHLAWQLAWEIFKSAPLIGVGPGEFAGAAFLHGLPQELASDRIWTSPHNLFLHLLAETGVAGTTIVVGALLMWAYEIGRRFVRSPDPATGWVIACVGVEFIHAMAEYPLWYAHFLGLTALLMGLGSTGGLRPRWTASRTFFAISLTAAAVLLGVTVNDYLRFDLASSITSGRTLASDSSVIQDRSTLEQVSRGVLAPKVEVWLFLAMPLDADDIAQKLALGERVLDVWPSSDVVARLSVFCALAGDEARARALLRRGLDTFSRDPSRIVAVVNAAPQKAKHILESAVAESSAGE